MSNQDSSDAVTEEDSVETEPTPKRQKQLIGRYWLPLTCCTEKLVLAQVNAHPRDDEIVFDDGGDGSLHDYYIQGEKGRYTSCTSVVHSFFPEFQADLVASNMVAKRECFLGGPYKEMMADGKDDNTIVCELVKRWNENGREQAALGTAMHRKIELFYNNLLPAETEPTREFEHFLKFHAQTAEAGMVPFRTEMTIWDEDSLICGSIDMLYVDKKLNQDIDAWKRGELKLRVHIVDWKRSKKVSKFSFGKTRQEKYGRAPCDSTPNANHFHYCLQVNLYRYLLEKCYNMIVDSMAIVVCHPNQESFQHIKMPDEQYLITKMVASRKIKKT